MAKVAFIGAGSTVFTRNLVGDLVDTPELADTTTIALMDIDAERLRASELVARRLVEARGAGARGEATPDRAAAPAGAAGPRPGPGRRRLRRDVVPGRRLPAVDRRRLRAPQALRAAPDDRRHAR